MSRRTGLGRGLDALIPGGEPTEGRVIQVAVTNIGPNPRQPRQNFDPQALAELADSIREHGVIQPLILTEGEVGGPEYLLIAGERRLLAARQAGLESVPAIVRAASELARLELALIENLQRADLSPLESAEAYRQLGDDFSLTHEQIAARVGKSRAAVTNTLRLLNLPDEARNALNDEKISEGHARALLALPHKAAMDAALQTVLEHGLNVRQTEELVRRMSGQKTPRPPRSPQAPELAAIENRLRSRLGTRVRLNRRGAGGTLVIHFYSDEELNALIDQIAGEAE